MLYMIKANRSRTDKEAEKDTCPDGAVINGVSLTSDELKKKTYYVTSQKQQYPRMEIAWSVTDYLAC